MLTLKNNNNKIHSISCLPNFICLFWFLAWASFYFLLKMSVHSFLFIHTHPLVLYLADIYIYGVGWYIYPFLQCIYSIQHCFFVCVFLGNQIYDLAVANPNSIIKNHVSNIILGPSDLTHKNTFINGNTLCQNTHSYHQLNHVNT